MSSGKKRFYSTFIKMTISFVVFGLLPLLILSILFFYRYTESVRETSIRNYSQINGYFAQNVSDVLNSADEAMGALYDYQTANGAGLRTIINDDHISDSERGQHVDAALQNVMAQSEFISSVHFVDVQGNIYSRYHDQGKTLRNDAGTYMDMNLMQGEDKRDIKLLGVTEERNICVNSDDFIFVLVRNFMDTSTIQKAYTRALGTLFVYINVQTLEELVGHMNLDEGCFYVYSTQTRQYLYSQNKEDYIDGAHPLALYESYLTGKGGYEEVLGHWIFYQQVGNTNAYTVLKLDNSAIIGNFTRSKTVMALILSFSCAFLMILYMAFSNRMSMPIRRIKNAMEQVEKGKHDVQVELTTNDEMAYVADGFNKMVQKLNDYINQVYIAQICQKDAELNALKMQIQPHYLYNTLDVIRMTALNENDEKTAGLLESLAHQLRYVIGEQNERVHLKDELEAIREYFVILRIRYEGRISLKIDARTEDMQLMIPKLLLQPVVENAIKHGLREKEGHGAVAISVCRKEDYLEIVVLDDGVGIEETKLSRIREALENSETGREDQNSPLSVGMKNVYDRIKLNCGKEYGYAIESFMGMGMIVTYRLPIWEEFTKDVESSDRG